METQRRAVSSINLRDVTILLFVAALIAGFAMQQGRHPVASAETRFTEKSSQGLNIVPASCPSDPHYAGECSGGPPQSGTSCNIYDDPQTIAYGESSTLSWSINSSVNGYAYSTLTPTGGTISSTGTRVVSPIVTTTYQIRMYSNGEVIGSCWRSLTVCSPGQVIYNNACISVCPAGTTADSEGQCIPDDEDPGLCTPSYFCSETTLMHRDAQCTESTVQTCSYACSGGACILPPEGQGNITVTPGLLRPGETTTVAWTTNDMNSCTVTENNPEITDSWTGTTGSEESGEITEQTTYTLQCSIEGGGTFTDRATVNIIPAFCETDAQGNCPN